MLKLFIYDLTFKGGVKIKRIMHKPFELLSLI